MGRTRTRNIRLPDTAAGAGGAGVHDSAFRRRRPMSAPTGSIASWLDPPGAGSASSPAGNRITTRVQAMAELGLGDGRARHPPAQARADLAGRPRDRARNSPPGSTRSWSIEEKSPLVEQQMRDILYDLPDGPACSASAMRRARRCSSANGDFSAADIALALAGRIGASPTASRCARRLAFLDRTGARGWSALTSRRSAGRISARAARTTRRRKVIDGSRALGGIGCHYMAVWMDRQHRHVQPDGRRGHGLDRPGAVHRGDARLRQHGRRHLFPFRPDGDPRRRRVRREHHLQDPVQRRRRDDRRPADRRAR